MSHNTIYLDSVLYRRSSLPVWNDLTGLEIRLKKTTNMNILVVRHNFKLTAQKWEQKLI